MTKIKKANTLTTAKTKAKRSFLYKFYKKKSEKSKQERKAFSRLLRSRFNMAWVKWKKRENKLQAADKNSRSLRIKKEKIKIKVGNEFVQVTIISIQKDPVAEELTLQAAEAAAAVRAEAAAAAVAPAASAGAPPAESAAAIAEAGAAAAAAATEAGAAAAEAGAAAAEAGAAAAEEGAAAAEAGTAAVAPDADHNPNDTNQDLVWRDRQNGRHFYGLYTHTLQDYHKNHLCYEVKTADNKTHIVSPSPQQVINIECEYVKFLLFLKVFLCAVPYNPVRPENSDIHTIVKKLEEAWFQSDDMNPD